MHLIIIQTFLYLTLLKKYEIEIRNPCYYRYIRLFVATTLTQTGVIDKSQQRNQSNARLRVNTFASIGAQIGAIGRAIDAV